MAIASPVSSRRALIFNRSGVLSAAGDVGGEIETGPNRFDGEMAAFDRLPAPLRELLRRAPCNLSALETLDWQRRIGTWRMGNVLMARFALECPDWRPDFRWSELW